LVTILGPIEYGKTKRYITTDPQREIQNTVLIGGPTVEVIAASTRYRVEIWNYEADYEGKQQGPQIYTFTSAAVLDASAYTNRTNVYSVLVDKINAYAGNNCKAYGLVRAEYDPGTSTDDSLTFEIGETVTQETSNHTAKVAACSVNVPGTDFDDDTAAGVIWLYDLRDENGVETPTGAEWLTTEKHLKASTHTVAATTLVPAVTDCDAEVQNATTTFFQGIIIVDDANYFTSTKSRGGINRVSITAGFAIATATTIIAGQYPIGIGTNMLAQMPIFDETGQVLMSGKMEYDFANGCLPIAGQTYERIVIQTVEGDETALGADKVEVIREYILWFNDASHADHTHDLIAALATAAAK
jgi:hypothetical protein